MILGTPSFQGEIPRASPRALPDKAAHEAVGAKLLSGDLESWKQVLSIKALALAGEIQSIYYLAGQYWLSWNGDVDVAKGIIPGDTTHRIYLTGLDAPRFTNLALATTGSEPYPVQTRLLGVPAPTSAPTTTTTVTGGASPLNFTDSFDTIDSGWVLSPSTSDATPPYQVASIEPGYMRLRIASTGGNQLASGLRSFPVDTSASMRMEANFTVVTQNSNDEIIGLCVLDDGTTGSLRLTVAIEGAGFHFLQVYSNHSLVDRVAIPALTDGETYDATIDISPTGTTNIFSVHFVLKHGGAPVIDYNRTGLPGFGKYFGFVVAGRMRDGFVAPLDVHFNSFSLVGASPGVVTQQTTTSYVVTFVNDIGEESAPSPASEVILRDEGATVHVTTQVTAPPDYAVTTKRIYRAVTGTTGTVFLQVAEIPLAQATYDDVKSDQSLGIVLPSEDWDMPPGDLRGIIALPNGIMAGFRANQLCLSAQNQPHAWPVNYRLNTDYDIVAIGAIDSTIVIGTKSFPYMAAGNAPDAYSMVKIEIPQACVSKRSVAYLRGLGVVFASPDGLISVAGPGQVRNITDGIFTREQWQALNPSSILAVAHDDRYFMFYKIGGGTTVVQGGYVIDEKASGFGAIQLPMHASAVHTDPVTDTLYMVLDAFAEPDDALLPVPPSGPVGVLDGSTIYAWDAHTTNRLTFRWKSKLYQLLSPTAFEFDQVKCIDYSNLVLKVYLDGVLVYSRAIDSVNEFRIPAIEARTLEYELIGTSRASVVQFAEDVMELQ